MEAVCGYLQLGVALMHDRTATAVAGTLVPARQNAVPVRILAHAMIKHWGRGQIIEERY